MQHTKIDIDGILSMRSRTLSNYIIPGLKSSLLGGDGAGCVRLFECSRNHQESITPHNHRFDFRALVLQGVVTNHIWKQDMFSDADLFTSSALDYSGAPGQYQKRELDTSRWRKSTAQYVAGQWYGMTHREVHSIEFSRGCVVLFFEGPELTKESIILEPYVDGRTVPTFKTEPWMFEGAPHGQQT